VREGYLKLGGPVRGLPLLADLVGIAILNQLQDVKWVIIVQVDLPSLQALTDNALLLPDGS
jgi:hypothetical protein